MKSACSIATCLLLMATICVAQPEEPVGPVKPVEVVNETLTIEGNVNAALDEPIQIENVADEDRFQVVLDMTVETGSGFDSGTLSVPSGKRLIVEFISADVRTGDTQRASVVLNMGPLENAIGGNTSLLAAPYSFPLVDTDSRISTSPGRRVWLLAERVELWADTIAFVSLTRGPSLDGPFPDDGQITGRISISGRIVDIPAP